MPQRSTDSRRNVLLARTTCFAMLALSMCRHVRRQADAPRVLAADKMPSDGRLQPLKNLNGYFPLEVPATREAWEERAKQLRRQILVAEGLWPMPDKTPANAVIHGAVDRDGYTVEKVYLESFPGHFVTGSLYRPKGKSGKLPAVLSPHGHWANGRFYDWEPERRVIKQDLVNGGDEIRDPGGAHPPAMQHYAQLARMGCVVFHYDMVGYGDSIQLEHRLHGDAANGDGTPPRTGAISDVRRPNLRSAEHHGLADLRFASGARSFFVTCPTSIPSGLACTERPAAARHADVHLLVRSIHGPQLAFWP